MPHTARDFKWDEDGDIELDETGDLKLATAAETIVQDIEWRLRSDLWDYEPDPMLSAGLDRFKGQPNTRETGDAIKEAVYLALTGDGRFSKSSLFVDVVPVSKYSILIIVFIQDYVENLTAGANPYDYFTVSLTFNLEIGLISRITGDKE